MESAWNSTPEQSVEYLPSLIGLLAQRQCVRRLMIPAHVMRKDHMDSDWPLISWSSLEPTASNQVRAIISSAMFIQFVSWMSNSTVHSSLDCGSGTFAFASSCAKDTYHRPTAGYINLCAEVCRCMRMCIGMQGMCAQQFVMLRLVASVMESHHIIGVGDGTKSDGHSWRPPS